MTACVSAAEREARPHCLGGFAAENAVATPSLRRRYAGAAALTVAINRGDTIATAKLDLRPARTRLAAQFLALVAGAAPVTAESLEAAR